MQQAILPGLDILDLRHIKPLKHNQRLARVLLLNGTYLFFKIFLECHTHYFPSSLIPKQNYEIFSNSFRHDDHTKPNNAKGHLPVDLFTLSLFL